MGGKVENLAVKVRSGLIRILLFISNRVNAISISSLQSWSLVLYKLMVFGITSLKAEILAHTVIVGEHAFISA